MKKILITAVLGAVASTAAHADFMVTKAPVELVDQGFVAEKISGFGREQTLRAALTGIVGEGYNVELGFDEKELEPVSWRGGRPRGEILDELLSPRGLSWRQEGKRLLVWQAGGAGMHPRLDAVLGRVVPAGYQIKYGPGFDQGMRVNYVPSDDWREGLLAMSKAYGLDIVATGKVIQISKKAEPKVKAVAASNGNERLLDKSGSSVTAALTSSGLVTRQLEYAVRYVARPGLSLEQVLGEWSQISEGWKVSLTLDKPVVLTKEYSFSGPFENAVMELLTDLHAKGNKLSPTILQSEKRVIITSNAK